LPLESDESLISVRIEPGIL